MAMIRAYEDRQIDEWERFRSLEYIVYCALTDPKERKSIFEYMRLPNDPSPEELNAAVQRARKEKAAHWRKRMIDLAEKGLIKLPTNKSDGGKNKDTG